MTTMEDLVLEIMTTTEDQALDQETMTTMGQDLVLDQETLTIMEDQDLDQEIIVIMVKDMAFGSESYC